MAIAVSLLLFSLLMLPCRSSLFQLLSTIFNSSRHFYCHAISIAASHFVTIQPDSNYRGFSFKAGPFFCWVAIFALVLLSPYSSCCFVVTTGCTPRFFLFWLSFFSSFSNRHFLVAVAIVTVQPIAIHIVVLSKPASYSPALFSIPVRRREHAYQSFIVAYGTGKYGGCAVTVLAGTVIVRLRYGRITW